jgi:hypothetical protein
MSAMTDAAFFTPGMLSGAQAVAGYIGGENVYHTWSDADWASTGSMPKLPVWVPPKAGTATQARADVMTIMSIALHYHIPRGSPFAFDLETSQADVSYMAEMWPCLSFFGYGCVVYGSLSTLSSAAPPNLWRWDADWTGTAHLTPGMAATQWTNGQQWDTSEISQELADILTWRTY